MIKKRLFIVIGVLAGLVLLYIVSYILALHDSVANYCGGVFWYATGNFLALLLCGAILAIIILSILLITRWVRPEKKDGKNKS
jgi:membrane protein implicated in regulation of membrane protease activity